LIAAGTPDWSTTDLTEVSWPYPLYRTDSGAMERPQIVFLHGLGGTHRYWDAGLDQIEDLGRITRLDLLGFGDSPMPWTSYTIPRHLAAIRTTLIHDGPFILVGHSLGAALALEFAALYPDQVRGLVLMGLPNFGGEEAALNWMRRGPSRGGWLLSHHLSAAITCMITRRVMGWLLPYLIRDLPRPVVEDLVKHTWLSSTSSLWQVVYSDEPDRAAGLLADGLPVDLIHGAVDETAPVAGARSLAAAHADWRLHLLDGIGHHPWHHAGEACREVIRDAVGRLAEGPDPDWRPPSSTLI
jgi:pimeloyl-ACP methyl ester carboxylesterase